MESSDKNHFFFFILFIVSNNGQVLSYWGRQIIAREVELEIMRRAIPKSNKQWNQSAPAKKIQKPAENESTSKSLPNHLRTLQPKAVTSKFKETVSFFFIFIFYYLLYDKNKQCV